MKIVVTGDSHISALKSGIDLLQAEGDSLVDYVFDFKPLGLGGHLIKPFFADRGDYAEMTDPIIKKRVQRLPLLEDGEFQPYYAISGAMHSIRLWRDVNFWTKYTPFCQQEGLIPVSVGLLRHAVLNDQLYICKLIEIMQRSGVKLFVIEAPKPFKHHRIHNDVDSEVIVYVDRFYRQVFKDWLAAKGVPVVEVPASCYDSEGFMLNEFRSDNLGDANHANKDFGAIMAKEIIKFLQQQAAQ